MLLCTQLVPLLLGQTTIKTYTKGRIEWVLPVDIHNDTFIKSMILDLSENALTELERNLTYKSSDRIHLIAFTDLSSYLNFHRKSDNIRIDVSLNGNNLLGSVYYPILITGNYVDIETQIRKGISKQFLQEYLHGFSYAQRFNATENQSLPSWLKEGFISYFSEGINREEFLRFQSLLNQRAFRNLNFINLEHQILFGKVLWYFIEQEKGKNQNSIFWSILKHAQSFENTFEYQFGITFKKWLQEKFTLWVKTNEELKNADYSLPIVANEWSKSFFYVNHSKQEAIHQTVNLETESVSRIDLVNNKEIPFNFEKKIINQPFPGFKTASFYPNKNSTSFPWTYVTWNNEWEIHHYERKIRLENAGRYTLIYADSSNIHVLQEILGKTYYIILDLVGENQKQRIRMNPNGEKICEISLFQENQTHFDYFAVVKLHKEQEHINIILKGNTKDFNTTEIYRTNREITNQSISDLIIIDSTRFTFVGNSPLENALYLVDIRNQKQITQKVNAKGIQFVQKKLGSDSIAEFYIANKQWNVNIIESNAPVFNQDTFQSVIINTDTSLEKANSPYKDSFEPSKFFISTFPILTAPRKTRMRPTAQNALWKMDNFQSWNYFHEHKLYFDNQDFDIPYDIRVSPTQQYNGPLLFNYHFVILDALFNSRTDFSSYSNINRRKIGVEIKHQVQDWGGFHHEWIFRYRLRQFASSEIQSDRNRNLSLSYHLESRKGFEHSPFLKLDIFQSEIIPINIVFENIQQGSERNQYLRLGVGLNSKNKHQLVRNTSVLYYWTNTFSSGILNIDNKPIWIGDLQSNLRSSGNLGFFPWKASFQAKYSISPVNITHMIGGTPGWISSNANTDEYYQRISNSQNYFLQGNLPLRGISVGSRLGHSYLSSQIDIGLPFLRLFPKNIKEKLFWKNLLVYTFVDAGMAFFGISPTDPSNPFNTLSLSTPNYVFTSSSIQNPWIWSYGIGIQTSVLGYPFKVEYGQGQTGNLTRLPLLQLSMGKNF